MRLITLSPLQQVSFNGYTFLVHVCTTCTSDVILWNQSNILKIISMKIVVCVIHVKSIDLVVDNNWTAFSWFSFRRILIGWLIVCFNWKLINSFDYHPIYAWSLSTPCLWPHRALSPNTQLLNRLVVKYFFHKYQYRKMHSSMTMSITTLLINQDSVYRMLHLHLHLPLTSLHINPKYNVVSGLWFRTKQFLYQIQKVH